MSFLAMSNPYTAAAMTGGSVLAGFLGGRPKTVKSSSTTTESGKTASTARSRRVLRPEQQYALETLSPLATNMILNPGAMLEPLRGARRTAVNNKYAALPTALRGKYLRGGQPSGKFGRAAISGELARLGELGDVDTDFSRLLLEERDRGMGLLERLLSLNLESEVDQSGTTDSTRNFSGTNVQPGNMAAGGIGAGLETLSAISIMNQMLKGGSSLGAV